MSLQRKCLTASAVTHGLLLLLVFVGSAFIPQKPKMEGPVFELVDIPDNLVAEANIVSGGDPNAGRPQAQTPPVQQQQTPPVAAPPQQPVKPPVQPPQNRVEPPVEKIPEPKVEARKTIDPEAFDLSKAKSLTREPPKTPKPDPGFDLAKAESRKIKPSTQTKTATSRDNNSAATSKAAAEAARALANAMKAVEGSGGRVGINPDAILGPGGKAAMSYDIAVALIYEREFKRTPVASRANEPAVEVEITVRRDGTVVDKEIKRPSGRAQFDNAVRKVLNAVKKVPQFPSDITSETRIIKINFNPDPSTL
jgi:TonB family protein